MTLGEVAQRADEIIGREPVRRADANIARQFEIDAGDFALRMQERALHLLGGADEPLAGAGELRARGAPVEQLGADRGLERRDAAADRRMVELEPLGGGDELPAAGDSEKDADVIPVHGKRLAHFRTADARSLKLLCAKSWRINPAEQRHQGAER